MASNDFFRKMTLGDLLDIVGGTRSIFEESKIEPSGPPRWETRGRGHGPVNKIPRRFLLWRKRDHSGVSGTGYVASGVEFPDGRVAVRWFGNDPSTSLWESVAALEAVHGHGGSTEIEWID